VPLFTSAGVASTREPVVGATLVELSCPPGTQPKSVRHPSLTFFVYLCPSSSPSTIMLKASIASLSYNLANIDRSGQLRSECTETSAAVQTWSSADAQVPE
jgi:hypothetical protein